MGGHRRKSAAAPILVAVAALLVSLFCASAGGEVTERDGVRVSVTGKLLPKRLPRQGGTPVEVSVAGKIVATRAGALPQLERLEIDLNSHGNLRTGDIPVCRLGHIDPSTTAEALAACRPALVGEGRFSADVRIPDQSPFPSDGRLLAFNGRFKGKPALLAHIYGTEPVPTSYVLPFAIARGKGAYGTALEASLPQVTGEWGYVTGVSMDLRPRFATAACPAPAGFPGVVFPLLRTRFAFSGGTELVSVLTRACKAR
jgi:hypothetical protein